MFFFTPFFIASFLAPSFPLSFHPCLSQSLSIPSLLHSSPLIPSMTQPFIIPSLSMQPHLLLSPFTTATSATPCKPIPPPSSLQLPYSSVIFSCKHFFHFSWPSTTSRLWFWPQICIDISLSWSPSSHNGLCKCQSHSVAENPSPSYIMHPRQQQLILFLRAPNHTHVTSLTKSNSIPSPSNTITQSIKPTLSHIATQLVKPSPSHTIMTTTGCRSL